MDIVEDQEKEAPPYDITDNGWSTELAIQDIMTINPGWDGSSSVPVEKTTTVFVPAGLLNIAITTEDPDSALFVEVLGQVLCKDMT